jgi:hypothetical protein
MQAKNRIADRARMEASKIHHKEQADAFNDELSTSSSA